MRAPSGWPSPSSSVSSAQTTWVYILDLQHANRWHQYSYALFTSFSHMLCIGYGIYAPSNLFEV